MRTRMGFGDGDLAPLMNSLPFFLTVLSLPIIATLSLSLILGLKTIMRDFELT